MTSVDLASQLESWHRFRAVADGNIVQLLGEVMRREDFRSDGATSAADWQVERSSVSLRLPHATTAGWPSGDGSSHLTNVL